MIREEYYRQFSSRITQDSERLFVDEFLFPLLGGELLKIVPQRPFLDSTGRSRRIDFSYVDGSVKLAIEVNGETYHAEGVIPNETFDDNLFRQNEIIRSGYKLIRFSYNMLLSQQWRPTVMLGLRSFFTSHAPSLLGENPISPNPLQIDALQALEFYRSQGWKKGIVILPTGTGKTFMSAIDAKRLGGPILFLVHRLDILDQSVTAYSTVWPNMKRGLLTGEVKENEFDCDVLFASKDTLRQPAELVRFQRDYFKYIVVDEVHHGQSPSYSEILSYFQPYFMLGMTATPDRTDRKDIFELFDYNKVFEVSLQEAIEDGYLVPYTYFGLLDNVDYSKIRYQNNKYRVDDLEKYLIIPERNAAILKEYLDKGTGDKAIGFCVSIKHANRMAEYFNEQGIPSAAITSESPDRAEKIAAFRRNEINVVFTVDLFNEGVDFPNVRVLLFLRPTESKTVFMQQLGRGLRLCIGKDRVRVLDFIGNYKRANQVRKWLAKSSKSQIDIQGKERRKKIEYVYSTNCEVKFDSTVEEILNRQDESEIEVTQEDLVEAYYFLAEQLGRKPGKEDLDSEGQYKTSFYIRKFDSWLKFLQSIGEYTEASYHYPQGVHLGHVLSILKIFGGNDRAGTGFDDQYIRLRGGLSENRLGTYQRQVKYKLLASMELGIIEDDRKVSAAEEYVPQLTAVGRQLHKVLKPLLDSLDLDFPLEDGVPSTRMALDDREYNLKLYAYLSKNEDAKNTFWAVFLKMPAVMQMLCYLYQISRSAIVKRSNIYEHFFEAPFVKQFCDQEGIDEATTEASRHRCPFLLNVLEACGLVELSRSEVSITKFLISAPIVRAHRREPQDIAANRAAKLRTAWPDQADLLEPADQSILKELFGGTFLTSSYWLKNADYLKLV